MTYNDDYQFNYGCITTLIAEGLNMVSITKYGCLEMFWLI